MSVTSADLAGDRDVIARAESIRDAVAAAADEIETTRRLPPDLLDRLHEARLFRLLLPRRPTGSRPIPSPSSMPSRPSPRPMPRRRGA
ncbi:hypothetical protein [Bradyrhizobium viridifuturi]|uniref:hypothetical protein n=1 Tax=Bradyrhizobium viridifuturi TaxID=1654716 RepID=UPI000ADBACE7|nr:hypothetical protein [Bradyrhizobium viridifuturi]